MDRLTERDLFGDCVLVRGEALGPAYFEKEQDYENYRDTLDRLADYEDTGLEPEEVAELKERFDAHWLEIFKAEEQGRLIVLPCKVGDTVYTHEQRYNSFGDVRNFVEKKEVVDIRIKTDGLWITVHDGDGFAGHRANGRSLFYTREEAEAALGGENHDDNIR